MLAGEERYALTRLSAKESTLARGRGPAGGESAYNMFNNVEDSSAEAGGCEEEDRRNGM